MKKWIVTIRRYIKIGTRKTLQVVDEDLYVQAKSRKGAISAVVSSGIPLDSIVSVFEGNL